MVQVADTPTLFSYWWLSQRLLTLIICHVSFIIYVHHIFLRWDWRQETAASLALNSKTNASIEYLPNGGKNYRKRREGPEYTSKVKFIEHIFI